MRKKLIIMVFSILCLSALSVEFNLDLYKGWNLFSVPIEGTTTFDFTGIEPDIWLFNPAPGFGVYQDISDISNDTLYPGTGYFVLSRSEQTVTLSGDIDTCIDYPELYYGWNMGGAAETKGEIIRLV
ncbi:MAG: hypothetical protein ACLFSQ_09500 [Candidatus Zixiibacteriota bacterium]